MVELHNNYIKVTNDSDAIFNFMSYLTFNPSGESQVRCFEMDSNNDLIVPRGFLDFLPNGLELVDKTTSTLGNVNLPDNLESVLPGITLRDDQCTAIKKMILCKRGIVQLSTGGGKTECMVGFMKVLLDQLGEIPDTLILSPTTQLIDDTIKRFAKYGIPATKYSKRRGKIEGIVITHPASVNNDLNKNPDILKNVKVFLTDECHRLNGPSWRKLIKHLHSVEYSLGVSATAIQPENIPITDLSRLDESELNVLGATGNVLLNIPPSYYISKGILANPVLLRMHNPADQKFKGMDNWHKIRKHALESYQRTRLISEAVTFFSGVSYKSLILINTKEHAFDLLRMLAHLGMGDKCRASFGGKQFYKWNLDTNSPESIGPNDEDVMKRFADGELTILIGSSHIYEGYDVPNLDVVVIAGVGKQLRRVVQGIGRVLRRTKTGKHAYIVDFTDHCNKVLARHSVARMNMCRNIIGVPEHQIFSMISFAQLKEIVFRLEDGFSNN